MIVKATIFAANFETTFDFYKDLFEDMVRKINDHAFELRFLKNQLEFRKSVENTKPFYHFALLIPFSQFDSAKEFVSQHVTLNEEDGKDEITFAEGVRSFFFQDPSGNVVEFIAKDLYESDTSNFEPENIRSLAEISLTVNNVAATARALVKAGVLPSTEKIDPDKLNFISDGETTILLVRVGRVWRFSTKKSAVYPEIILVDGTRIESDQQDQLYIEKIQKPSN